jgi:hypothetical protein
MIGLALAPHAAVFRHVSRLFVVGLAVLALSAGAARCETTVAFYSHGWGMGPNGMMYFPHAFVVIQHADKAGDPLKEEAWGYTAASTWDIGVFAHPAKGMVDQPDPTYRKKAVLHFTVEASDAQYAALHQVIDAWGGPDSPLYDLNRHNCVGFAAAMASALGLQIPDAIGRDPAKFLEAVRRLNPGRFVEVASGAPPAPAMR